MQKNILILFITICVIDSCKESKNIHSDSNALIKGSWTLTSQNIPRVFYFKENELVVETPFDTTFIYGYKVTNTNLSILDSKGVLTKNKILKLTKDTLIFRSLEKNLKPQQYEYEPLIQNRMPQIYTKVSDSITN